ncbi:MAG: hypothetical protein PHV06_04750 [bacterium]|nr:hypothetical protein [bacterium]
MSRLLKVGLILAVVLSVALFFAGTKEKNEVPNLIGIWTNQDSECVVVGDLQHHEDTSVHTFSSLSFTFVIKEQRGRVFYGTRTTTKHTESVVGYIGPNNDTVHFADHDGYFEGVINADGSMTIGYLEAGEDSQVAAISTYFKK